MEVYKQGEIAVSAIFENLTINVQELFDEIL
jgi:hypothetical protein